LFGFATGETSAVPSEETTAVPPGKTTNNIEYEEKNSKFKPFDIKFVTLLLVFLWSVMECPVRFKLVFFVLCVYT